MDTSSVILIVITGAILLVLVDLRAQIRILLNRLSDGQKVVERPPQEATPASAYVGAEHNRAPTAAKLSVPNRVLTPGQFAPNLQSPPRPNGGFGSKT